MEKIIRQNTFEQKNSLIKSLRIAISCRKLLLHCSTATKKFLKTLAIITAENEADHRVDGAVCGGHEVRKVIV